MWGESALQAMAHESVSTRNSKYHPRWRNIAVRRSRGLHIRRRMVGDRAAGAVTHAFNQNQRYVGGQGRQQSRSLPISLPGTDPLGAHLDNFRIADSGVIHSGLVRPEKSLYKPARVGIQCGGFAHPLREAGLWHPLKPSHFRFCPRTAGRGQTPVATYHYDNNRTGWNSHETTLTPANVGSSSFGLLKSIPLDDQVDTAADRTERSHHRWQSPGRA
jgi:hypothetical protein